MFSILVWSIYSLFVGSIAKSIVPGEEKFGFLQTIALGVSGSYVGGALLYMIKSQDSLEPSGIFMGVVGAVISLIIFNKLHSNA